MGVDYASSVNPMRETPGAWRRTAIGAGLIGPDGSTRPTIFAEMSALAARTGAINLGQGFPDEDGPAPVLEAARDAIAHGVNQYPPIFQTKTRKRHESKELVFRENMVIVIQPNLITEDEKMGLQFGETLVVTKKGCETLNAYPREWITCQA